MTILTLVLIHCLGIIAAFIFNHLPITIHRREFGYISDVMLFYFYRPANKRLEDKDKKNGYSSTSWGKTISILTWCNRFAYLFWEITIILMIVYYILQLIAYRKFKAISNPFVPCEAAVHPFWNEGKWKSVIYICMACGRETWIQLDDNGQPLEKDLKCMRLTPSPVTEKFYASFWGQAYLRLNNYLPDVGMTDEVRRKIHDSLEEARPAKEKNTG